MQLERIKCTHCGGEFLEYDPSATIIRCDRAGCGATFLVSQAKEFAKVVLDHETDIKNLRQLLDNAMETKDMELTDRYAGEIRMLIPDDAYSAYCEALAQKKKGKFEAYHNYLKKAAQMTQQEAEKILDSALREYNFTIHDKQPLLAFIAANYQQDLQDTARKQLDAAVKRLALLKDLYAIVPRDVFICHSSSDPIARRVYEVLTDDGVKCWFSQVNLPPQTANYWDYIRSAIRNCKIILVITSIDSMMRDDPEREMRYAAQLGLRRLELKIDDTPHNTYFRHYFDGLQWIYLDNDVEKTFDELKRRVYQLLHPVQATVQPPPVEPPVQALEEPAYSTVEIPTRALKVRYLDGEGQEISSQVINLVYGNHKIRPRADLVPEGYALQGRTEASVTVDADGVSPGEIVFRYQSPQASKPARVRLAYTDQSDGKALITEERELPPGQHRVAPDAGKLPSGYSLESKEALAVKVENGKASPEQLVFRCVSIQKPIAVTVNYMSESYKKLESSQELSLKPGEHRIHPKPKGDMSGYELITKTPIMLKLADGDEKKSVTFYYAKKKIKKQGNNAWARLGWKLTRLIIILWLLCQALVVLSAFGALEPISSEMPVLKEIAKALENETFLTIREVGLPMLNLASGYTIRMIRPVTVAYFASLNVLGILLFSLFFGVKNLRQTAERMSRMLLWLVMPLNALYFWTYYVGKHMLSDTILQDKVVAFLSFMVPALVAYAECFLIKKIVAYFTAIKAQSR